MQAVLSSSSLDDVEMNEKAPLDATVLATQIDKVAKNLIKYCRLQRSYFLPDDNIQNNEFYKSQYNAMENHTGLLYFDVNLQGAKFSALLDSGAGKTFIDKKCASKNGIELEELDEPFMVSLANGTGLLCNKVVAPKKSRLKFKQFNHVGPIYVIDLKGEHDIVLGLDFLYRRNPIIESSKT